MTLTHYLLHGTQHLQVIKGLSGDCEAILDLACPAFSSGVDPHIENHQLVKKDLRIRPETSQHAESLSLLVWTGKISRLQAQIRLARQR